MINNHDVNIIINSLCNNHIEGKEEELVKTTKNVATKEQEVIERLELCWNQGY